ncbi:hypothetical protein DFP72DRAFT_1179877 [Ephemerocybe angulata]|uniref:Uncharacterized protein n=1 Tax=Ephemerocybe angulata TaxID=980116 RepID=A0A8H6H9W2_9AGAR|nr:hypothetical protein DFP72DRAFT_1179877 [Tulosesus angulatus]
MVLATSLDRLFRFCLLPEDIARTVFEMAANDPDSPNWTCALVSKKVQSWVEPILYRQIIFGLDNSRKMPLLHRTLLSSLALSNNYPTSFKKPSFFSKYVKTLSLNVVPNWNALIGLLNACPNIHRLDFHRWMEAHRVDELSVGNLPAWQSFQQLRRLHAPGMLFEPSYRHFRFDTGDHQNTMFRRLTHLELYWDETLRFWSWGSLKSLPCLTHLCISPSPKIEAIELASAQLRGALACFPPTLVVCVFTITSAHWFDNARDLVEDNGSTLDERIVVAVGDDYYWRQIAKGEQGQWLAREAIWRMQSSDLKAAVDNEDAFWKRAEKKVSERRRGQKSRLTYR